MSSHTMDEIRRKRLARLAGNACVDSSAGECKSTEKSVSNSLGEPRDQSDVEMSNVSQESSAFTSCVTPDVVKYHPQEYSPQQRKQMNPDTSGDAQTTENFHDKLLLMLSRVLMVRFETQIPDSPLLIGSDSNVVVRICSNSLQSVPDGPPDIRYYKSLCFDLISSALSQVRIACYDSAARITNTAFLQVEYLSICVHHLKVEKERLSSRKPSHSQSKTTDNSFALSLLGEVDSQLRRHVLLVLSGFLSPSTFNGPSHLPYDPWLAPVLTDSALLRLTVPCVLPNRLSLWAVANAVTYRQPLSTVLVSGQLEPPAGSDEVVSDLLEKLHAELAHSPDPQNKLSVVKIFEQLLAGLHYRIRRLSIDQHEYNQILTSLVNLCQNFHGKGSINRVMVQLPFWSTSPFDSFSASSLTLQGNKVERLTFLGPFFAASVFADDDPAVARRVFPAHTFTDSSALQSTLTLVWNQQFVLITSLLSKATRASTLDYLTNSLRANTGHGKLHSPTRCLASEGFMFNLSVLFQRLAAPIHVESVDARYLFHADCRLDLHDTTRINATNEDVTRYATRLDSEVRANGSDWPSWKFSTECFFLTVWALHLGLQASMRKYERRLQVIGNMTRNIRLINTSRDQWSAPGNAQAYIRSIENTLKQYKEYLEHQELAKRCCDLVLFHRMQSQSFGVYYASLSRFLLNVAGYHDSSGLSLPETSPELFALLPEYFLDDIANYLIFVLKHSPPSSPIPIDPEARSHLIALVLFVICRGNFVRNPYLVAKFVEVLFFCDPAITGHENEFHTASKLHPLATTHLIGALIRLYTSVEFTGAAHEFYDKFSIRYNIATVFITWWHEGFLKNLFIQEAETHQQEFVKFTNRVVNDMSYLLEESLGGLKKIRELQDLMDDTSRWSALPRDQQTARMGEMNAHEQQVRSHLTLANQTVRMLSYLTSEIQDPFLRPEIVDNLAATLNSNLVQLCGPRCSSLKVRNPETYGWNPKMLLAQLVSIYRHLDTDAGEFAQAVAKDERYYSRKLFEQAHSLMTTHGIQTPDELDSFARLTEKVEEFRHTQTELDYGDIPSEFCDTLTATLMADPVKLPQSGAVVDRSTIVRHLLNQETDPFCRMPLKEDELIPLPELKASIASWKAEREAQSRRNKPTN